MRCNHICDILMGNCSEEKQLKNHLICMDFLRYENMDIYCDDYEIILSKKDYLLINFYNSGKSVATLKTEYDLALSVIIDQGHQYILCEDFIKGDNYSNN